MEKSSVVVLCAYKNCVSFTFEVIQMKRTCLIGTLPLHKNHPFLRPNVPLASLVALVHAVALVWLHQSGCAKGSVQLHGLAQLDQAAELDP